MADNQNNPKHECKCEGSKDLKALKKQVADIKSELAVLRKELTIIRKVLKR